MLVEITNLTKSFGNFKAVDDVSFSIREGEIVGLLGPSGAGKTTTIHMILGLIAPSAGAVRIFGLPIKGNRERILEKVSFSAPYVAFPGRLTVYENLRVFACLYNVPSPVAKIDELLSLFGISELRNRRVSRLSSGENTRVGLCKAFMNDPKLLLVDEPTANLDPQIASEVKQVFLGLQRRCGTTILYSSHNMAEVESTCQRVVFLNRGRVIANGTPIEVTERLLNEKRNEPALEEVFLRVARGQSN